MNWAVMISGTGSNLGAFIETNTPLRLVVSHTTKAYGLKRARRSGVPTLVLNFKKDGWQELFKKLQEYQITHVFLLGFMRILPESFIKSFKGQIVNLHPSLLPLYPGLEAIKRAFEDRKGLGVTVHHVVAEVDAGDIIMQAEAPTQDNYEDSEFFVHIKEQQLVRQVLERTRGLNGI